MEVHVCRTICTLLQRDTGVEIEAIIRPMNTKPALLEGCREAARGLFRGGCEQVVILWDERPPWPDQKEQVCWHPERIKILEELQRTNLSRRPVSLVYIEREFESWLLFDHHLLSDVLSTAAHRVRIPRQKNPDRMPNPKGRMMTLFEQHGKKYVDFQYGRRFAAALNDLNRLKQCPTFRRFAEKITGQSYRT
jgi:hypothetical protein